MLIHAGWRVMCNHLAYYTNYGMQTCWTCAKRLCIRRGKGVSRNRNTAEMRTMVIVIIQYIKHNHCLNIYLKIYLGVII